jgi:hypothetical protein
MCAAYAEKGTSAPQPEKSHGMPGDDDVVLVFGVGVAGAGEEDDDAVFVATSVPAFGVGVAGAGEEDDDAVFCCTSGSARCSAAWSPGGGASSSLSDTITTSSSSSSLSSTSLLENAPAPGSIAAERRRRFVAGDSML